MSAHAHLSRWRRAAAAGLAATAAALAFAGCGALPPEAPVAQASIISTALATISSTCGESYRFQEFTRHPNLTPLAASARQSAVKLAAIAAHHPEWIYQGATLTQIDALSAQLLRGCSLTSAARVLQHVS
jgi:hypothetical protein